MSEDASDAAGQVPQLLTDADLQFLEAESSDPYVSALKPTLSHLLPKAVAEVRWLREENRSLTADNVKAFESNRRLIDLVDVQSEEIRRLKAATSSPRKQKAKGS